RGLQEVLFLRVLKLGWVGSFLQAEHTSVTTDQIHCLVHKFGLDCAGRSQVGRQAVVDGTQTRMWYVYLHQQGYWCTSSFFQTLIPCRFQPFQNHTYTNRDVGVGQIIGPIDPYLHLPFPLADKKRPSLQRELRLYKHAQKSRNSL